MKSPELTTQHRLCTEKKPLKPFALKLEVDRRLKQIAAMGQARR